MRVTFPRLLQTLASLSLLAMTSSALAQDRIVVLGFSGPNGGAARSAVRRVLGEEYEIVSLNDWNEVADRLGGRGSQSQRLRRVAEELGVKAIVSGGVRRARRQWRLSVVVRDGATGEVVGQRGGVMPAPTRAGAIAGAVARRVMPMIAESEGAAAGAERPTGSEGTSGDSEDPSEEASSVNGGSSVDGGNSPEPAEASSTDEETPSEVVESSAPLSSEQRDEEGQVVDDEDLLGSRQRRRRRNAANEREIDFQEDEPQGSRSSSGRNSSPWGWLEIGLEVNISRRIFHVPIDPACDLSFGTDQVRESGDFDSLVFPEIGARLSFYLGGIFTSRWPSNFGIEIAYNHHLYLKVLNGKLDQEVTTEAYAITAGVNYRFTLGNADRGALIVPRVGYSRYSFFLGDRGNDIVPPFTYDHVYVGLNFYIPIATRYIGLELGASYLAVITTGDYATRAYNASGQTPTTHGFEANAGLSGQIYAGLRWRIGFEYLGFFSDNQGKGEGWGIDPTTYCDPAGECLYHLECYDTDDPSRPVTGGIRTVGTATDLIWRVIFGISYRIGWDPDSLESSRSRRSRSRSRSRSRGDEDRDDEDRDDEDRDDEDRDDEDEDEDEEEEDESDFDEDWDDGDW